MLEIQTWNKKIYSKEFRIIMMEYALETTRIGKENYSNMSAISDMFTSDHIIAKFDNKIVGFISYYFLDGETRIWLLAAYTNPKYRNKDIFKNMYSKLVEIAKEKECYSIIGTQHIEANHVESSLLTRKPKCFINIHTLDSDTLETMYVTKGDSML